MVCITDSCFQALKGEVVRLEVMVTKEKHILLHKIPGQPLGIQLTRAHAGAISVVTVKKIAVGSPAHTSGKLWYALSSLLTQLG